VYTSDLKGYSIDKCYISLIGSKNETDKTWLNKSNLKSKNKNLFEIGNIDEFLIKSSVDLNKLNQIRIGHESFDTDWQLEKVEVVNKKDGTLYLFTCNRWLSNNEDDGKMERLLPEPKDSRKNSGNVKLKIEMKHDEISKKYYLILI